MKLLVNTPSLEMAGGVANFYRGLKNYWTAEVHYNTIGSRKWISGSILLPIDILKYILKILVLKPNLILLNPSLGRKAVIREGLYLRVSNWLKVPTIVFFRGWNEVLAEEISKNPTPFVRIYNRADKLLVLASSFKEQLLNWGISKPISLMTTKVDNELVSKFNVNEKVYGNTVLFLARVEEYKGIFTALDSFKKIKDAIPEANMIVAGDGDALEDVKAYTKKLNIDRYVKFTGYLSGNNLIDVYKSSDIYILPSHGEGMPNSVLEAMAFGLPIISRPVGGLVDFFENGKMGYLIESLNPEDYYQKAISLLNDKVKLKRIGLYNHHYANEHFMASEVAKSLEQLFQKVAGK